MSTPSCMREVLLMTLMVEVVSGNMTKRELKGHRIWISDMGDDYPEIELLIGSDIYGQILTDMWDLERIGIADEVQTFSKAVEDQLVQEQFLKGLSRYEDGRYCSWKYLYNKQLPLWRRQNGTAYVDFGPEQELSLQNVEPISPVLGLQWDHIEDSLFIPFKSEPIADLSKRKLLSIVHSVFDPLGFVVPVMVPAKLILQEAWATEANWDLPLPDELQSRFSAWYHGLSCISQLKFERRIGYGKETPGHYIFSVMPKVTIPRLELLACVLGSRLAKYVVTALSLRGVPTYYWTDATVALCWIQREDNWECS
ncbi:endonuclease [Caerostris extrusa]|uniref:Endonuclease n=1 Tax=Caerostris extrusa TaxID=172846 RepID=A0AAV4NXA6_CAEEX|nr:endonuclease [Caerostris extrusa]